MNKFMKEAIYEAKIAYQEGEVPVGAVVVMENKVIARAHNLAEKDKNPTHHAEILAINEALKVTGNKNLKGASLYVTLEPCAMCIGAAALCKVDRVYFGAYDTKSGACGGKCDVLRENCYDYRTEVFGGIEEDECRSILAEFFEKIREDKRLKQIKPTDIDALYPIIEDAIKNGGSVKIKVSGFSMYPLVVSRRDSVVLTGADSVKVGDVSLFKREDGDYILHRIVGKKDGAYMVRGDYEQKIEYPVYEHQIIAVAEGFYRNEKYISCDSKLYKLYKAFWMRTVFIRPIILTILANITSKKKKKHKKNVES